MIGFCQLKRLEQFRIRLVNLFYVGVAGPRVYHTRVVVIGVGVQMLGVPGVAELMTSQNSVICGHARHFGPPVKSRLHFLRHRHLAVVVRVGMVQYGVG